MSKLYTATGGYAGVRKSGCNCRPRKPRMSRSMQLKVQRAIDRALAQHDGGLITMATDSKPLVPRDVFDKPRQPEKHESTALIPRGWQS